MLIKNAVRYESKVTAAAAIIPKIGTNNIFKRLIKAAIRPYTTNNFSFFL